MLTERRKAKRHIDALNCDIFIRILRQDLTSNVAILRVDNYCKVIVLVVT